MTFLIKYFYKLLKKNMMKLERVIKQKCKFRGRTGWGEEDHFIFI